MTISKMWRGQTLPWAMNFLKAVEVKTINGQKAIVVKSDHNLYELDGELNMLRHYLQDEEISHIPPEGRLPHTHYRDPVVFKQDGVKEGDLYVILEKATVQDNYVEYYLRIESGRIYVGFEAEINNDGYGKTIGERHSHEREYYGLGEESKKFKELAGAYIEQHISREVQVTAQEKYQRHLEANERLFSNLFKKENNNE